jgi:hypothetical protein
MLSGCGPYMPVIGLRRAYEAPFTHPLSLLTETIPEIAPRLLGGSRQAARQFRAQLRLD